MNHERFDSGLSPHDHAALFNAAKRHAAELRDAALRDFWRGVARRVRSVRAALSQLLPRPLHGRPWWS